MFIDAEVPRAQGTLKQHDKGVLEVLILIQFSKQKDSDTCEKEELYTPDDTERGYICDHTEDDLYHWAESPGQFQKEEYLDPEHPCHKCQQDVKSELLGLYLLRKVPHHVLKVGEVHSFLRSQLDKVLKPEEPNEYPHK
jgi:hypothetical protein